MVVDPWGTVLGAAGTEEETLTVDFDMARVAGVRSELPVLRDRVLGIGASERPPNPLTGRGRGTVDGPASTGRGRSGRGPIRPLRRRVTHRAEAGITGMAVRRVHTFLPSFL